MAASAEDKDYVHLVVEAVAKSHGKKPQFKVVNVAEFERKYTDFDVQALLKEQLAFEADTVIVAIGENVPALKTDEEKTQFKQSAVRFLTLLKQDGKSAIYVRSSFWANEAKDTALIEACAAVGGVFVDISTLSKNEANYARSERKFDHEGVARHPGDRGMLAIAQAISAAMEKSAR
jgi:alpha-galactosidase